MYTLDDRSSPLITDKFSINSTLPATCEPKLLDMYIVDSKSRNKKKKPHHLENEKGGSSTYRLRAFPKYICCINPQASFR